MKPFVLLATRAEDGPAEEEYELFLRHAGLAPRDLLRVRLERDRMPRLDLDAISGIFVGGGPYNASDDPTVKSPVQRRVEAEFASLLTDVTSRDTPFLGACYGIGTLGAHIGATIDRRHGEPISVTEVSLTEAGRVDPLLAGLPNAFSAFVGHKEAISALPATATLLASSERCPVQMFRVGRNVYATQFHPELDLAGIVTRIDAYRHHGYFEPHEFQATITAVHRAPVTETGAVLRNFVARYAR